MTPANLANVLGALAAMVHDQVQAAVASEAMPLPEATALAVIAKYPDCSIEELRGPLALSHSGCVRLVDRLVAAGHVERRPGKDGRAVGLRLTRSGRSLGEVGRERREDVLARAVAVLDRDEREALASVARKLLVHGAPSARAAGRTCRLCDYDACRECPFEALAAAAEADGSDGSNDSAGAR